MRIACPELDSDIHFTPLRIALTRRMFAERAPDTELVQLFGGTGDVVRSLGDGAVDVGIGVTEGILAGIAQGAACRIVATFVETPLTWALLVAPQLSFRTVEDLRGQTFGISQPGGGAHLNLLLLARELGWAEGTDFRIVPLGGLITLLSGLKRGTITAFLWEAITTKPLVEAGEARVVRTVLPDWPGFVVAARTDAITTRAADLRAVLGALRAAARAFHREAAYAVHVAADVYSVSWANAERWVQSVKYSIGPLPPEALARTGTALRAAGVIDERFDVDDARADGFADGA
jgi:ABC-type nitrate/sulfonate/bicarbonate transport system substrate-binding protein